MSHYTNGQAVDAPPRKAVTIRALNRKKRDGVPITMITAYDYSAAVLVDRAGVDMVLVGDSLAQVMLGMDDTVSITVDEMLHHCRAVARGAQYAFLVGDLPFMSYNVSVEEALRNAGRYLKEGRMHAVKLEGGRSVAPTVAAITQAGIPVVGHVGFTPQSISQLSGYRIQARTGNSAFDLYQDALALQEAGAIAVVLEMVPTPVAEFVSSRLAIPTIGIGAGAGCDGQVLVYHDMLGFLNTFEPRFLKRFAQIGPQIVEAVERYIDEVETRQYPDEEHGYTIKADELQAFHALVADMEPAA